MWHLESSHMAQHPRGAAPPEIQALLTGLQEPLGPHPCVVPLGMKAFATPSVHLLIPALTLQRHRWLAQAEIGG